MNITITIITGVNLISLLILLLIHRKVSEGIRRQAHILGEVDEKYIVTRGTRIYRYLYIVAIIFLTIFSYFMTQL